MSIESKKLHELVESAVSHQWSVPEFQRGFVWKPTQVRDLAESLWREYPVGSLLLWNSKNATQVRTVQDGTTPALWIVDGQQRTTALCVLYGRRPYWWKDNEDWNKILKRFDIRFDISTKEGPYFVVANAVTRKAKGDRYIPLSRLISLDLAKEGDQKQLATLAEKIKSEGLCEGMNVMEVYTRLSRICGISGRDIPCITISNELEEVVEIFSRLNSRGTRVTEADIYLGVVASKSPGWVRDEFLPFIQVVESSGFDITPNLLFRSLTAIGIRKVTFKEVDDSFWSSAEIMPAWHKCQAAWKKTIQRLQPYGVLTDSILPTQAALVTLISLQDKFADQLNFDSAFYWFVQASRFARYSAASNTALEDDLKDIDTAKSGDEAIEALLRRVRSSDPVESEDFKRDYTDGKFWRFLLYLTVYDNKAQDWNGESTRLGFEGKELMADFDPQWHHIFPRKFLMGKGETDNIDSLSNIAVIGPKMNIRISAQDPMQYFKKYGITDEKLGQQFISGGSEGLKVEQFEEFVETRAAALAFAANKLLRRWSSDLSDKVRPAKPELSAIGPPQGSA